MMSDDRMRPGLERAEETKPRGGGGEGSTSPDSRTDTPNPTLRTGEGGPGGAYSSAKG